MRRTTSVENPENEGLGTIGVIAAMNTGQWHFYVSKALSIWLVPMVLIVVLGLMGCHKAYESCYERDCLRDTNLSLHENTCHVA